jgi:hypothetical protein
VKDKTIQVNKIIDKLVKASDALSELMDIMPEEHSTGNAGDCRMQLKADLNEYIRYLENATWYKKSK